jgi:hypothetical protein
MHLLYGLNEGKQSQYSRGGADGYSPRGGGGRGEEGRRARTSLPVKSGWSEGREPPTARGGGATEHATPRWRDAGGVSVRSVCGETEWGGEGAGRGAVTAKLSRTLARQRSVYTRHITTRRANNRKHAIVGVQRGCAAELCGCYAGISKDDTWGGAGWWGHGAG